MTKAALKIIKPLIVFFLLITGLLLIFWNVMVNFHISALVVLGANLLLLLFAILNILLQVRHISNPNPNVMVRWVMAGMIIKLFGLGAAVLVYLFAAGESRSVNAVFIGMGLYIMYTWLEVRISLRLNPKK